MVTDIGSDLQDKWDDIDGSYREICDKIISFALTHERFETSHIEDFFKQAVPSNEVSKSDIAKSTKLLVGANILSARDGTLTIHSKVEKEYLASKFKNVV